MPAYIGYNNLLESATLTADSEATDFPVDNVANWNPSDGWKPASAGSHYIDADLGSAQTVDYLAVFGHDLADYSGTVKLQYSDDAISYSDAFTAITPTINRTLFKVFTGSSHRYWRILTTSTGTASVLSVAAIGQALQLPNDPTVGSELHGLASYYEPNFTTSQEGKFLGQSVRLRPEEINIEQRPVAKSWMDSNFRALAEHVQRKPWFYMGNSSNDDEAVFCRLRGNITSPTGDSSLYTGFRIPCEAYHTS